jgi:hypothetical protein
MLGRAKCPTEENHDVRGTELQRHRCHNNVEVLVSMRLGEPPSTHEQGEI